MKKLFLLFALMGAVVVNATKYTKVTSTDDLKDGDIVVLVNEKAKKVSGAFETKGTYLTVKDATLSDSQIEATDALEFVLGAAGANWTLTSTSNKKLGADGTNFSTKNTAVYTYTIAFDADKNVAIASTATSSGKIFYNASSPRFKLYTSTTMEKIQLYKKVAGSNPKMSISATTMAFDKRALVEGSAMDSKTLTITGSELDDTKEITIALKHGGIFSVTPNSMSVSGGEVTVSYSVTAEGEFKDTVVVTAPVKEGEPIVCECALSVVISKEAPTGTSKTWNVLQDLSQLQTGDKVFIGTAVADYVVGIYDYDTSKSNILGAEATYTSDRHKVTANDVNAYTVEITDGVYTFMDANGKYLCDYNAEKNLSSTETLDNKAKWTVTIKDDIATIKNKYASSYQILYNKTAGKPIFCCYSAIDANVAPVYIYAEHALEYQEPEKNPAIAITCGGEPLLNGATLDYGEVVYDNSWGTESVPYSASKSIKIAGTDLSENISITLSGASAFSIYTTELPLAGGNVTINFETRNEGEYNGALLISSGTISYTINLTAKAVKEASEDPSTKTQLSVSKYRVYLNSYFENELGQEEMDIFTFSAKNLKKSLYCKWLNSDGYSIPSWTGEQMTVSIAGFGDVTYGSSLNLGTADIENAEITVYVKAFNPGYYQSQLYFYSYKEDKVTIDVEYRVDLVVNMTTKQTPDPDPEHNPNPDITTAIENTTTPAVMNGIRYNILGQPVDETYHGIVILNGKKKLQ